jgi:hypothetical protein
MGNGVNGGTNESSIKFTNNQLEVINYVSSTVYTRKITNQVFRDPSAWYHIVVSSNSSTALNIYVNGVQVTSFATNVGPSSQGWALNTGSQSTGIGYLTSAQNFDGYMAEINFIDGQALTPSSFGSFSATTGVWQPAKYAGTYGLNGFYLPFNNTTSTTTLGYDLSGNGNNWTPNNFSLTSGVTYDSVTDVPTLTSATASNFCVWSPINKSTNHTVTNGNLTAASSGATSYGSLCATIGATSGKWYWEMTYTRNGTSNSPVIGFGNELFTYTNPPFGYLGSDLNAGGINVINGNAAINGVNTAYGSAIGTNDVVMFAMDVTNRKFYIGKNGTWFNSGDPAAGTNSWPYSATIVGSTFFPAVNMFNDTGDTTFGQRPFAYTPPTGFVALNTYNLPTSTIVKGNTVMDVYLNTGNGTARTDVIAFQPDLVWTKSRSASGFNIVQDSVRGAGNRLITDGTYAELYSATYGSFTSTGFAFGNDLNINTNAVNYVDWFWKAGGTSSSNTNGTITSTVSVNASAGFSVVTYTSSGSAGSAATVGHGLGVAPTFIIAKSRNDTFSWQVYHVSLGNANSLNLNLTSASGAATVWNNTTPTSSVFSIASVNNYTPDTYVAYCWTPIAGYSAFGSYTGNGSTSGPFVYCGFQPKFILIKSTTASRDWIIWDTARNTYNIGSNGVLFPDTNGVEYSGGGAYAVGVLSNGFYLPVSTTNLNASGETHIYAAFASNPFKYSLAF